MNLGTQTSTYKMQAAAVREPMLRPRKHKQQSSMLRPPDLESSRKVSFGVEQDLVSNRQASSSRYNPSSPRSQDRHIYQDKLISEATSHKKGTITPYRPSYTSTSLLSMDSANIKRTGQRASICDTPIDTATHWPPNAEHSQRHSGLMRRAHEQEESSQPLQQQSPIFIQEGPGVDEMPGDLDDNLQDREAQYIYYSKESEDSEYQNSFVLYDKEMNGPQNMDFMTQAQPSPEFILPFGDDPSSIKNYANTSKNPLNPSRFSKDFKAGRLDREAKSLTWSENTPLHEQPLLRLSEQGESDAGSNGSFRVLGDKVSWSKRPDQGKPSARDSKWWVDYLRKFSHLHYTKTFSGLQGLEISPITATHTEMPQSFAFIKGLTSSLNNPQRSEVGKQRAEMHMNSHQERIVSKHLTVLLVIIENQRLFR